MENSPTVNEKDNGVVFTRTIKAGKRIYYLDVRRNKRGELFLTITESRKINTKDTDQPFQLEKQKIFLYKEDFTCFLEGLEDVICYVKGNNTVDFVPHANKKEDENKFDSEDMNENSFEQEIEVFDDEEDGQITFKLDF